MDISEELAGTVCIVTAKGRLDGSASPMFVDRLEKLTSRHSKFLMDFSGVDFVTSAGLRAVLTTVKKVKSLNGAIAMCGVQPPVREILDITGLSPMIRIFGTRSEGLAALPQ